MAKLRVDVDPWREDFGWSLSACGSKIDGLERVAGVDLSVFPDQGHGVAAVVILSFPALEVIYEKCVTVHITVPYIPSYLAFREVPAIAALLNAVPAALKPQIVFADGNGAFHPRRCGLATHLGITIGLPTIGVAKEVMKVDDVGSAVACEVAKTLKRGGDWAPLVGPSGADPLAVLLRPSDTSSNTIVVSTGHLVSLPTAATISAAMCRSTVVEPIRQADRKSRAAVKAWLAGTHLDALELSEPGRERRKGQSSAIPIIRQLLEQRIENGDDDAPDLRALGTDGKVWRPKPAASDASTASGTLTPRTDLSTSPQISPRISADGDFVEARDGSGKRRGRPKEDRARRKSTATQGASAVPKTPPATKTVAAKTPVASGKQRQPRWQPKAIQATQETSSTKAAAVVTDPVVGSEKADASWPGYDWSLLGLLSICSCLRRTDE